MGKSRSAESTIAGYLYQFDKSIIEILKLKNIEDTVIIEGIEDIDIESEELGLKTIQVKYYEATEYNHSIIAKAVRYLFYNYIDCLNGNCDRREYYIYGHYNEGQEKLLVNKDFNIIVNNGIIPVDQVKLNFLTYKDASGEKYECFSEKLIEYITEEGNIEKRTVSNEDIEAFIYLLKIDINANSLDEQNKELIQLLEDNVKNCKNKTEAEEFYYNNALKIIFNLAKTKDEDNILEEIEIKKLIKSKKSIQGKIKRKEVKLAGKYSKTVEDEILAMKSEVEGINSSVTEKLTEIQLGNIKKRTINKKEFLAQIDTKAFLFNKWYSARLGKNKYCDYIKDILVRKKRLNYNKSKYLVLGREFNDSILDDTHIKISQFFNTIIEDSYQINSSFSEKSKPWTIVFDIKEDEFKNVLRKLDEYDIKYNSGRGELDFNINTFNEEPIVNTDSIGILKRASYQIKLITLENFKKNLSDIKDIDVAIIFEESTINDYSEILKNKGVYSLVVDTMKINTINDIMFLFEKKSNLNDYFRVISVSPIMIQIEVMKAQKFKDLNENFTLGSYIKISDEQDNSVIGILKSYKIKEVNAKEDNISIERKEPSFILDIQPIGHINNETFKRGNKNITIPPSNVEVANNELMKKIFYLGNKEKEFCIGNLPRNLTLDGEEIEVVMDGNKFFNKHIAVVGSTGSGKSCTVAKILHEGMQTYLDNQRIGALNNSHIILFDLHGEYENSFKNKCRYLNVETIKLPYWLMSSEELEDYFLDADGSDHNQRNIFKKAVTLNKKWNNLTKVDGENRVNYNITYDSPVYFNIKEVLCCIDNYNKAKEDNGIYKWSLGDVVITDCMPESYEELKLYANLFLEKLVGKGSKKATLNFTNFISRLENKIFDYRLKFLLNNGVEYREDLINIIKQFIGHEINIEEKVSEKKNITIIDLSGMPFETVNIVVALVSKLIFKLALERKRIFKSKVEREVPFLLVYEEAHNYIPKSQEIKYRGVKLVVERIAKEGRKYGVSAMIVSQRPSEISETIFSQCNTFVVMRLTNPIDQNYIKKLLPEDISSVTDNLSAFDKREALVLGDAVKMPVLIEVDELEEDMLPKSNDISFIQEWRKDWIDIEELDEIINKMTGAESIKVDGIKESIDNREIEVDHADELDIDEVAVGQANLKSVEIIKE